MSTDQMETVEQMVERFVDDWMKIESLDRDGCPVAACQRINFKQSLARYIETHVMYTGKIEASGTQVDDMGMILKIKVL